MRKSNVMLIAALLAGGFGFGAPPAPDRRTVVVAATPKRRETDWLGPPVRTRHVPFSSARQHARAARLYMKTMRNGHTVMQMAGSGVKAARRYAAGRAA